MFPGICPAKIAAGLVAAVALLFSPLLMRTVHAQVAGATLSGTVSDQSGAVVPKAGISIKNIATGVTRASTTDPAGFYSAPNLLPGTYEVTAAAPGFSSEAQTGITLRVGAQQVLNFTLRVGQVAQTVEVAGEAPTVQLASSAISAVVNSTTVRELPLNGRSWTDLATLQPGVDAIQTQPSFAVGANRGNRGFGNQITIDGARPQQNNYRLDGVSINDYANSAPGSVIGGDLGVDAIEEFSVLTSNSSAEYGRTSGGVVNAATRSGTNEFHAGVYEFLRNSSLDAPNFFDNHGGIKKPPFRRNQFGVSGGGPMRKDRLFFFGDYEGIRQSKGITNQVFVPSDAARTGNLCSVPDNPPCPAPLPNGVDPLVQKYLPFWPRATGGIQPGTNGSIGLFTFGAQQVINENFFTIRGDDKISEKDSLTATYLGDFTPYTSPDGLNAVLLNTKTKRQIVTLEETHIFTSTLVNTARFGYSRDFVLNNVGASAINPLAKDPSLAAMPGEFAAEVAVPGFLSMFTGGVGANSHYRYGWNSFQGYDDAFWTRGTHSLKLGGTVERMQSNRFAANDPGGVFTFSSLRDFLISQPKRFTADFADSLTPRGLRQTIFGLYIQDDWRARPNLTLNLGLRWEMATVPTEVQNRIGNLLNLTDPTVHLGSLSVSNSTLRNFEPRVGFAWDPFHNGKTAVRGGFGIFDVLPLTYPYFSTTGAFPFTRSGAANLGSLPPGTVFYSGASQLLTAATSGADSFEQHPHRSYVMQWNLNVQRELAPNLTALLGYVGSRGVHQLFRVDDLDMVLPTKTSAGYLFLPPDKSGTTLNPNFGSISGNFFEESTSFHALELGVQKTMSHGVELQTSFTWGRSIDTGSAVDHGDQFSNSISTLPWYDLKSIRGPSDFNITRTLVISLTWQLPSPKSFSGPAEWITNGWELGGIYKASDGTPFTATFGTGGDPQGLNNSDDWAFPNRLTGPGCGTLTNPGNPDHYIKTQCFAVPTAPPSFFAPIASKPMCSSDPALGASAVGTPPQCLNLRGNAGRNILIGPGVSNLDFSLFKNNYVKRISESFNVQFRAEFFNILNHANFAVPIAPDNTDIFDSTGAPTGVAGKLTSTAIDSRQIQFALKIVW
jgi:hypothetical protein